ncbi:hypothetical protein T484DRAFT_3149960 [Baffinella frigidus]|nr:hypothetical protein T484DRAFT_3149960 [Cryptophyta sp. CCMP2293]
MPAYLRLQFRESEMKRQELHLASFGDLEGARKVRKSDFAKGSLPELARARDQLYTDGKARVSKALGRAEWEAGDSEDEEDEVDLDEVLERKKALRMQRIKNLSLPATLSQRGAAMQKTSQSASQRASAFQDQHHAEKAFHRKVQGGPPMMLLRSHSLSLSLSLSLPLTLSPSHSHSHPLTLTLTLSLSHSPHVAIRSGSSGVTATPIAVWGPGFDQPAGRRPRYPFRECV